MSNKKEIKTTPNKLDTDKERLYKMAQISLVMVKEVLAGIERVGLTNEQFVINWLDALNEISVKY